VIERAMDQLQQSAGQGGQQQPQAKPGPDPQVEQAKAQAAGVQAQAAMTSAQAAQMRAHTDQFKAQADAQLGQAQIQAENTRTQAGLQSDHALQEQSLRADMQQAVIKATERHLVKSINDPTPIEVPTR
jgi:ethanolamine ammonia-lyase small subunit